MARPKLRLWLSFACHHERRALREPYQALQYRALLRDTEEVVTKRVNDQGPRQLLARSVTRAAARKQRGVTINPQEAAAMTLARADDQFNSCAHLFRTDLDFNGQLAHYFLHTLGFVSKGRCRTDRLSRLTT